MHEPGGQTSTDSGADVAPQTSAAELEQALRESEERYRHLTELSSEAVLIHRNGYALHCNAACLKLFGVASLEELQRRTLIEWVHPDYREAVRQRMQTAVTGQIVPPMEQALVRPDGDIVHIEARGAGCLYQGQPAVQALLRDITPRKQAAAALRTTELMYQTLVNSVEGIVWEVDAQTFRFRFVSQMAERLLGYPVERWLTEENFWPNHLHPDDRDWVLSQCMNAIAQRRDHTFEYRMIAADNRVVWLRDLVTVVVENDTVVRLRGVMFDVTKRKTDETQLRVQAQLLDSVRESVTAADLDGRITYWGKGAQRLYGWAAEEAIGRPVTSLICVPGQEAAELQQLQTVLRLGFWSGEHELRRKNGSTFIGETLITLVTDERGEPTGFLSIDRDVTERHRNAEALRQSEERWRSVVTAAPMIIWALDQHGVVTMSEGKALASLGLKPGEMVGKNAFEIYSDRPELLDAIRRALAGESVTTRAYLGNVVLETRHSPLYDKSGKITGIIGVSTDVSERVQAEQRVRESELRYRTLFTSNPEPTLVYAENTLDILAVNDAAVEHYGYSHEEFLQLKLTDIRPPEDVPSFLEYLRHAMPGYRRSNVWRHRKKDGTVFEVEVVSHELKFDGIDARVVVASDITERQRAERARRESEERFQRFMDNSPTLAWITDDDGRVIYVNQPFLRATGFERDDVIDKRFDEVFPPEFSRGYLESIKSVVMMRQPRELTLAAPNSQGEPRQYLTYNFPMSDRDSRPLVGGVAVDITERIQTERHIRRRIDQQAGVSSLGQLALSDVDMRALMHAAAQVAAQTLDVELAQLLELLPDGKAFILRACVGWPDEMIDHTIIGAGLESQSGYTLLTRQRIIVEDLRQETRFAVSPALKEYGAISGMSVIVAGSEKPFGVLSVHSTKPRAFTGDDVHVLQAIANVLAAAIERKRAEEALRHGSEMLRLMLNELDHRVRNNLAALAALVDLSAQSKSDVRSFASSIRNRVQAMSSVHSLLSRSQWSAVDFRSLLESLLPADLRCALDANGPEAPIPPRYSTAMGMVLQELVSNSLKYGVLRLPGGKLIVRWTAATLPTGQLQLQMTWHEPAATPAPSFGVGSHRRVSEQKDATSATITPGLGTSLIQGLVRSELQGEAHLSYPPTGALHRFVFNLDQDE